jgi:modulator of FtsH protease
MLVAVLLATPDQSNRVVAVEIALIASVVVGIVLATGLKRLPGHGVGRMAYLLALPLVPMALLIAGAVSLWCHAGGGLYWVTAAIVSGLAAATANAWVLVVEIKR